MPRSDWNIVSNTNFVVPLIEEEQKLIGNTNSLISNLIAANECKQKIVLKIQERFILPLFA